MESELIQNVRKISEENVHEADYEQQINRWNRYLSGLEDVKRACLLSDFRFRLNLKSTYSKQRTQAVMLGLAFGLIAMSVSSIYDIVFPNVDVLLFRFNQDWTAYAQYAIQSNILFGFSVTLASSILFVTIPRKPPQMVHFEVNPKIFIDDRHFVRYAIRAMEREKNDPSMKLPKLEMNLPSEWIKQQSLLFAMNNFQKTRLF